MHRPSSLNGTLEFDTIGPRQVYSELSLDLKKILKHTLRLIFFNDFNRVCVSVVKASFVFHSETDIIYGLPSDINLPLNNLHIVTEMEIPLNFSNFT